MFVTCSPHWTVGALAVAVSAGLATLAGAAAGESLPGPYVGEVERVVDGDTVRVKVRIWLAQEVTVAVRLADVDAPEMRGSCGAERERALAARDLVADLIAKTGGQVRLRDVREDKFGGRVVAHLEMADGRSVGAELRAAGLATRYGDASPWCPLPPASAP